MTTRPLREIVLEANLELARQGLAKLTWGNASAIDRERGFIAIKPSGVPYASLHVDAIVVVDLDGLVIEGVLRPSTDTLTHTVLYRSFPSVGGITHTHSTYATTFAQAGREIPILGTTHADHFFGAVPVTRTMVPAETESDYEVNTGHVIVERFARLDPSKTQAVLVAQHGPFVWGADVDESVSNAIALEAVAELAFKTLALAPKLPSVPIHILERHYTRKHGPGSYYGNEHWSALREAH